MRWTLTKPESLAILSHALVYNSTRSPRRNANTSYLHLVHLLRKFGVEVTEQTLATTQQLLRDSIESADNPKAGRLFDLKQDLLCTNNYNWLRYRRGLKAEMSHLSEHEFNTHLRQYLTELKTNVRIFQTEEMYQRFEESARALIDNKLAWLGKQLTESKLTVCGVYAIGSTWAAIVPNPQERVGAGILDAARFQRPAAQIELILLGKQLKQSSIAWAIFQVPKLPESQHQAFAHSKGFQDLLEENLGLVPDRIVHFRSNPSHSVKPVDIQDLIAPRAAWILGQMAATTTENVKRPYGYYYGRSPNLRAVIEANLDVTKLVMGTQEGVAFTSKFLAAVKLRMTRSHQYYFTWGKISSYFKFAKSMNWKLTRSEELAVYGMYLEFSPNSSDEENAENSIAYLDSILQMHHSTGAGHVYDEAVTIIREIAAGKCSPLSSRVRDMVRHDLAADPAARELDWKTRIKAYPGYSPTEFYEWALAYTGKLLNEPSIYVTPEAKGLLEDKAVKNLKREREFYKRELELDKWVKQREKKQDKRH